MTFDDWIDDNMDTLHDSTVLGDLRRAFNAEMMTDVHTDNSKVIENLEKENAELKEALKHFNPCCEWNDDVHACEFMVRAPEYARELEEAKRIVRFLLEYGRYEWIDPNSKEFEAFCDMKKKAEALVGGDRR